MKARFIFLLIIYFCLSSYDWNDDIWLKISNKTWSSSELLFGSQLVFIKNKFEKKKAIFQLQGSGCYVTSTTIFDVDIISDTIKLIPNSREIIDNENQIIEYTYDEDNKILKSIKGTINYRIISSEPIVYKLCNKKVDIEALKNDTITINNFRK